MTYRDITPFLGIIVIGVGTDKWVVFDEAIIVAVLITFDIGNRALCFHRRGKEITTSIDSSSLLKHTASFGWEN